jgi:ankyrin repeat protein
LGRVGTRNKKVGSIIIVTTGASQKQKKQSSFALQYGLMQFNQSEKGKASIVFIHLQRACQNCDAETNSTPAFIPFSQLSPKDKWNNMDPLFRACADGYPEDAMFLMERGFDLNIKGGGGEYTALMMACSNRLSEVAMALIEKGADLNLRSKSGHTALSWSCMWGQSEIAKVLIDKGADLNIKSRDGATALDSALSKGLCEVATALIMCGADFNLKRLNVSSQRTYEDALAAAPYSSDVQRTKYPCTRYSKKR